MGTEDGKLAFVEDVDDDPDFSDAYDIPMAHFNGTLRSFVLLREAEDVDEDIEDMDGDAIGSGDEGEYLVGVSDDGKVVVIKLDDGEPEDYAVLHASYDGLSLIHI